MKPPQPFADLLARGFALFEAGRPDDARQVARRLGTHRPEPPGLAYLLGLLALAEGQGRKAAQHLARAMAQNPVALPPALAWARAQSLQGRPADALAGYRRLQILAPDLPIACSEAAELTLAAGNLRAALIPLERAVRLRPDHAGLRNNIALALRATDRLDEAERNLRQAVTLDPQAPSPYANLAGLLRHRHRPAAPAARRAARLDPTAADHQRELAQAYAASADDVAAIPALRSAVALLPARADLLWLLAQSLRRTGRDGALPLFRWLLRLDPSDGFGAGVVLAQLGAAPMPAAPAAAHIAALYDQYATSFESDLRGALAYRGPEILLDALQRGGLGAAPDVLDLGCGTGLMGAAIRSRAQRLDGIDLSPRMVEEARRRAIYDDLAVGDLVDCLAMRPGRYDLLLAADVLIHLGDLAPLMTAATLALRPGGGFAFTVEQGDQADFALSPSGRYTHADSYLRRLAESNGLTVLLLESTATRREQGRPVAGLLCLLAAP
jgi:predicted TPR repeat methyltransferase